jgi:predicted membrane-bound spermidine synthase
VLLRRGTGERAIGAVYAANTMGAIAGVVLAVHLGMPGLGLKGLIILAAGIDILLGLLLLWRFTARGLAPRLATVLGAAAVAATAAWAELDSLKMASGVYRQGAMIQQRGAEMLFHRDGKTATVNLVRSGDLLSVTTNGKSDAMVNIAADGEVAADEPTMVLAGALPIALRPNARSAAVVGIGSGISSHVLLASDLLQEVDTVEIEPAMVEAARGFRPRNRAVFDDPRSRIHIEDAKTFFSVHGKRVRAVQSLGQRRSEPLHRGVLPAHPATSRARRPVRTVAAALRDRAGACCIGDQGAREQLFALRDLRFG